MSNSDLEENALDIRDSESPRRKRTVEGNASVHGALRKNGLNSASIAPRDGVVISTPHPRYDKDDSAIIA